VYRLESHKGGDLQSALISACSPFSPILSTLAFQLKPYRPRCALGHQGGLHADKAQVGEHVSGSSDYARIEFRIHTGRVFMILSLLPFLTANKDNPECRS